MKEQNDGNEVEQQSDIPVKRGSLESRDLNINIIS